MALEQSDLSPRELAPCFTDEQRTFVSESTVCRLLKPYDLIASPGLVVVRAVDAFDTKTTRPNEMSQTDFTYFKIIGWGGICLSTDRPVVRKGLARFRLDRALRFSAIDGMEEEDNPVTLFSEFMRPGRVRKQGEKMPLTAPCAMDRQPSFACTAMHRTRL